MASHIATDFHSTDKWSWGQGEATAPFRTWSLTSHMATPTSFHLLLRRPWSITEGLAQEVRLSDDWRGVPHDTPERWRNYLTRMREERREEPGDRPKPTKEQNGNCLASLERNQLPLCEEAWVAECQEQSLQIKVKIMKTRCWRHGPPVIRAYTALAEEPSSVPSTSIVKNNNILK